MAEKGKGKRFFSALGGLILVLIAAGVIYLTAVLLQPTGADGPDAFAAAPTRAPVTRMQAAQMDDAGQMARMFEGRLPAIPSLTPRGRGENRTHDSGAARLVTLAYNGVTISAVQPATAAPLLLHSELDVSTRSDLTALNLPAVLAHKGEAYCLYFSDEAAAYAIYAPKAGEDEFLALIGRLQWVTP